MTLLKSKQLLGVRMNRAVLAVGFALLSLHSIAAFAQRAGAPTRDPLLVDQKDTWPSLLWSLIRNVVALPRHYVLYGHLASAHHWATVKKCFSMRWKDARWDFWNQPARNLQGYRPWRPDKKNES